MSDESDSGDSGWEDGGPGSLPLPDPTAVGPALAGSGLAPAGGGLAPVGCGPPAGGGHALAGGGHYPAGGGGDLPLHVHVAQGSQVTIHNWNCHGR